MMAVLESYRWKVNTHQVFLQTVLDFLLVRRHIALYQGSALSDIFQHLLLYLPFQSQRQDHQPSHWSPSKSRVQWFHNESLDLQDFQIAVAYTNWESCPLSLLPSEQLLSYPWRGL
ncbi:hypothetical protein V8G54_032858 [Vigna mungo]|uniref:Uncharacterized protein n=1 Tax=Vigna mungo TaxID=3915 RepID=A0AAQ3MMR2_VIGMU